MLFLFASRTLDRNYVDWTTLCSTAKAFSAKISPAEQWYFRELKKAFMKRVKAKKHASDILKVNLTPAEMSLWSGGRIGIEIS